ncbi:hypothetical protein CGRA01v4_05325 [Colletotrichum graminicola]|nr:hypothetical protein CGRA01v4_05325 [Colletotrichum graminicola]
MCFHAMFIGHMFRLVGLFFQSLHSPVLLFQRPKSISVVIHAGGINGSSGAA